MGSKVCEKCGLMFAYLTPTYCYVAWVVKEHEPRLTEEQVLGFDTRPCPECIETIRDLDTIKVEELEHIETIHLTETGQKTYETLLNFEQV